jgi:hypothetical protein
LSNAPATDFGTPKRRFNVTGILGRRGLAAEVAVAEIPEFAVLFPEDADALRLPPRRNPQTSETRSVQSR